MQFNCPEQLSGFSDIHFYLLSETSNWPEVLNDETSAQIIFNPEIHSVDAVIDEDSINIDVREVRKDLFSINAGLSFINRTAALEQLLDQYKNKPGIIKACLNNGTQKIYGTNLQPLYLTPGVDDGNKPEDRGRTSITIKGETRKRPVYYSVVESE